MALAGKTSQDWPKEVVSLDGESLNVADFKIPKDRRQVQVSMNLVDYERTPIYRALELVRLEAARYGVPVVGTEIVGLVPLAALLGSLEYYLQMESFHREQGDKVLF